MSCSSRCQACPVPPGLACIMCDRGRCEVIAEEAARLARDPRSDAPWHRIAMESAGVPVQPQPRPESQPPPAAPAEPIDPELPPLWRMAVGFVRDVSRHVINGMPKRRPQEYERIMGICKGCDHIRSDGRCGKQTGCGCHLEIKASWALTSCPEGKW